MRHKIVLSSFIFALLSPAPAALAQGECGLQTDPGNPETVICDPQDYPGGITYDSLGDLTLEVPDDEVDLRLLDEGVSVTGIGGDNIFWDSGAFVSGEIVGDADAGTFDGAVLDYLSDTGKIDILVGSVIKGLDNATHAIRAESTGGGNVSVTTLDDVNRRASFRDPDPSGIGIEALTTTGNITIETTGAVASGRAGGLYGIHAASSGGGNIDISTAGIFVRGEDDATHGILAETTGTGNVTINSDGSVSLASSNPDRVAAIEAVSDTGDITINTADRVTGSGTSVVARTGGGGTIDLTLDGFLSFATTGVNAVAESGNITIDAGGLVTAFNSTSATAFVTQTDGLATINLSGEVRGLGVRGSSSGGVTTAVRSTGGGDVVFNMSGPAGVDADEARQLQAPFDFSGLGGSAEVNFNAGSAWFLTDQDTCRTTCANGALTARSVFSGGDDVVNIGPGASLAIPFYSKWFGVFEPGQPVGTADQARYSVQFGAGPDVFHQAGDVYVAPAFRMALFQNRTAYPGEIRLQGLAEFRNSGNIWLGANFGDLEGNVAGSGFNELTDVWPDDILAVPEGHFEGVVDADGNALGRIFADVHLNRTVQTGCGIEFREDDRALPAADCIDLRGGSAGGRTLFVINQIIPGDRGAYNPDGLVMVDVSGGDPAATDPEAFGIAPESHQYSPQGGGIIDKGVLFYSIGWDPDTQQFKLYGLPAPGAQQAPLLAQAANDLWRTSIGAWFDRRVNQRDAEAAGGLGNGLWIRGVSNHGDRDVHTGIVGGGTIFAFDNSYSQHEKTATIGWDMISRGGDIAWVAGGMLGYARSNVTFDDSPNSAELRGMHAGLYASLTRGQFYADLAVNQTWLDVYNDIPAMNLRPEGTVAETEAQSLGGQIEAGWRWRTGRLSIEPLVGFSYVKLDGDPVVVPADDTTRFGAEVRFNAEPVSQRGSLGLRLRLDDVIPAIAPASVGLTTRVIEEFDGEAAVSIINLSPQAAPAANTFDGTFGQVTGDVSVTNATKTVAGFLKVDSMFHDDYESLGLSVGFRAQW